MKKPYTYPGSLGSPSDKEILRSAARGIDDIEAAKRAIDAAAISHYEKLVRDLCVHFSIKADEHARWVSLALKLAEKHVPAFRFEDPPVRGRPRKKKTPEQVYKWLERAYVGPKPRGRRRDPVRLRALATLACQVDETVRVLGLKGRGSQKAALAVIAEARAKQLGKPVQRFVRVELPKLQKQLSEARRLIPEIRTK